MVASFINNEFNEAQKCDDCQGNEEPIIPRRNHKEVFFLKKDGTSMLDIALFIRLGVAIIIGIVGYNLRYMIKPVLRGFSCSDKSIRFTYNDSTIESSAIFFVGIPSAIFMTVIGEFILNNNPPGLRKLWKIQWKMNIVMWKALQSARFISIWMLGMAINISLFNVFKVSLGSLRPNFLDVCKPRIRASKMIWETVCKDDENFFFAPKDYECAVTDDDNQARVLDAKLSFYSGHAAASFFFATFIILYTHIRITTRCPFKDQALPIFFLLYSILFAMASYVASTRITDNKHHPIDVFVGTVAGISMAILTVYLHKEFFLEKSKEVMLTTTSSMKTSDDSGSGSGGEVKTIEHSRI